MSRPFPPCDRTRHEFHDVATGLRMHVALAGPEDGAPVLLLHGWPQHWWCWRGVIPALAEAGYRVIAPDLRGAGWTDVPAGGYDKEQFASDVLALLDALGVERCAFLGHDWGAWTGQLMALREPGRFSRMVLCNIPPVWPPRDRIAAARNVWRLSYQLVGLPRLGPAFQGSRGMNRVYEGIPPEHRGPFRDAFKEPARAVAGSKYYATFVARELPALLRDRYAGQRLRPPLLVLHGTADPVIRPFQVEAFRQHADDVEIEWVHGSGHFVVDERPELIAERTLAFLGAGLAGKA
jgi:pimeloyl-ACP methyl ester carboxylesterase